MTFPLAQDPLFRFLEEKKYEPILDKDSEQIYILINFTKQEVPIFLTH
jgi:hypothetical protein